MNKWKCYICGHAIIDSFSLFSLSEETDRVFLAHDDCCKRIEPKDQPFVLKITKRDVVLAVEKVVKAAAPRTSSEEEIRKVLAEHFIRYSDTDKDDGFGMYECDCGETFPCAGNAVIHQAEKMAPLLVSPEAAPPALVVKVTPADGSIPPNASPPSWSQPQVAGVALAHSSFANMTMMTGQPNVTNGAAPPEEVKSAIALVEELAKSMAFGRTYEALRTVCRAAERAPEVQSAADEAVLHNYAYQNPFGELKAGYYWCLCGWQGPDRASYWKHLREALRGTFAASAPEPG